MTQMPNECECCATTQEYLQSLTPKQSLSVFMGMWMCPEHVAIEQKLQENSKKEADARVAASRAVITQSRQIDSKIEYIEDTFNAQTISIVDIKKAIDENPEIENKDLALAEELHTRFNQFSEAAFEARKTLSESTQGMRAIQEYMSTFANKLRAEEREKYQLVDKSYTTQSPKLGKKQSPNGQPKRTPKKTGYSKEALRNICAQYNVPMEIVQTLVVALNLTPEQAAIRAYEKINGKKWGE